MSVNSLGTHDDSLAVQNQTDSDLWELLAYLRHHQSDRPGAWTLPWESETITTTTTTTTSTPEPPGSVESGGGSGRGYHPQGLQTMRPGANLHGNVNIMLGGAMLSVVITVVCFVCYCCHRNIKKRSNSIYRQQWLENEANMEIYSVEQYYDTPISSMSTNNYSTAQHGGGGGHNEGGTGYFMDNVTGHEYQSLPVHPNHPHHQQLLMSGSSGGHHQHHQFHHHHHHQGPPPSYDTVLAQDEMAAARRKSFDFGGTMNFDRSSMDGSSSGSGASGTGNGGRTNRHLLQQPQKGVFVDFGNRRKRGRATPDLEVNDFSGVFGVVVHENGREEACHCHVSDSLQVYCRNCGQFVDGELAQGHTTRETDSSNGNWSRWTGNHVPDSNGNVLQQLVPASETGSCIENLQQQSGLTEILQDLQCHSTARTGRPSPACINNNNNGPPADARVSLNGNENESAAAQQPGSNREDPHQHVEQHNNNCSNPRPLLNGSIQQMQTGAIQPVSATANDLLEAASQERNGNNPTTTTGADDDDDNKSTVAPDSNNNNNNDSNNNDDTFRNLTETSGLVRLDLSQIIDQTGLPTYEAALHLESSGYV
ncbi:homeobox protein 5 [Uranotaenia lowii]|uniref:homeobox protein 5 n=1 Tax=Uranotaenia lowii TaxID=190385 RepID=UPI00247A6C3A|nr:homeobox protein 5 [Uranotaenia lowii]